MSHIPLNLLEVQAMDSNPRVNAGKFIRDFSALAASLGSNLLDGGLLEAGAISTNAEYAADFPDFCIFYIYFIYFLKRTFAFFIYI